MWASCLYGILLADLCTARIIEPSKQEQIGSHIETLPASTSDERYRPGDVSHVAVSKRVRRQLLRHFSPVIYLHPDDQYLPADPAKTFEQYYNVETDSLSIPNHDLAGMPLTYDDLEQDTVSPRPPRTFEHHQSLTTSTRPTELALNESISEVYNDFRRPSSNKGRRPRVTAPVTSQARVLTQGKNAGKILLQYWYWHHFNGAQGFSVKSNAGAARDAEDITRWEWWPLAIHNADWEHTTVTLSPRAGSRVRISDVVRGRFRASDYELESVYYTVHAEVKDKLTHFEREGSHPVVYSHLNSHACYAVPGDYWNKDPGFDGFVNSVVRVLSFGRIQQIKIIDIGFDPKDAIRWADYEIHDISDASEGIAPKWALWKGHWGDPVDQTRLEAPPSYVPARTALRFTLWLLKVFGKLKKFVKPQKKAPKGPIAHWNWKSLDVLTDDWVPRVKAGPSTSAILWFLVCVALAVGLVIAVISCLAIALFVMTRYLSHMVLPGYRSLSSSVGYQVTRKMQRAKAWRKVHELESQEDDDAINQSLLSHEVGSGRPSESFDTERPVSRKFEGLRELFVRIKKGLK